MLRAALPAFLALVLTLPLPAYAQPASPVELAGYVKLEKTTIDEDGRTTTQFVEPEVVVPGDRLIFGTRYANRGAESVENFVVSTPLPETVVLSASADPQLLVSVDGGQSWGQLADLWVDEADGTRRRATTSDVDHVRAVLTLIAPGESGTLEFPVTVR